MTAKKDKMGYRLEANGESSQNPLLPFCFPPSADREQNLNLKTASVLNKHLMNG